MSIFAFVFWLFMALASLVYAALSLLLLRGLQHLASSLPLPGFVQEPTNGSLPAAASPAHPILPKVSVLISARNEEKHLANLLNILLRQDYPENHFDIWVVDDRSTDGTSHILRDFSQKNPGRIHALTVESVPIGVSPKKHALAQALAASDGEILVTTDADCLMGESWLSTLIDAFTPRTGLVLGLTTYSAPERPNYWDKTIALEFASYAFVSASLVGLGFPVSGNANNIAYRRQAHAETSENLRHEHLISGDDDFLLQGIHATGHWNIGYATASSTAVTTAPPDSPRHFWEQRKRWAGKCMHYQIPQKAFLSAIYAYYAGIFGSHVCGAMGWGPLWPALGLFALKSGCDYAVMATATKQFKQKSLMQGFFGAALLHIPLILAAVLAGVFGTFTWKDQTFKTKAS